MWRTTSKLRLSKTKSTSKHVILVRSGTNNKFEDSQGRVST